MLDCCPFAPSPSPRSALLCGLCLQQETDYDQDSQRDASTGECKSGLRRVPLPPSKRRGFCFFFFF